MAAQLFAAARVADSAIEPGTSVGDVAPLLAWLRANVHERGNALDMGALLERATGRPLARPTAAPAKGAFRCW